MADSVVSPLPFDGERAPKMLNDLARHLALFASDDSTKGEFCRDGAALCQAIAAALPALLEARKDGERLDWLEARVIEAAGRKIFISDPSARGMWNIETWGSMDTRDLIDAASENNSTPEPSDVHP